MSSGFDPNSQQQRKNPNIKCCHEILVKLVHYTCKTEMLGYMQFTCRLNTGYV